VLNNDIQMFVKVIIVGLFFRHIYSNIIILLLLILLLFRHTIIHLAVADLKGNPKVFCSNMYMFINVNKHMYAQM